MLTFFRNNKLVVSLFAASLLIVCIGATTVSYVNRQAQQTTLDNEQVQRISGIALHAEQQLQTTLGDGSGAAIADVIPAASVARVAAINEREVIIGSADWCETRMVKPADEWTLEDQQTFAKHCI
ncbi:DUF3012 domain-containing protein [Cellvibrio mixtus]|uniref:DUF3012 domain-containing protein n=1 Tax=Cellvibrio mixtus TaxID=39650 RepID=UPI000587D562|nr:DUF3012 domain-containing protein [Cellvibrio mixtus]